MSFGRGSHEHGGDLGVGQDVVEVGGGFHALELGFDGLGPLGRGDDNPFEGHLEVVEHGIEVAEAVLADADEGVLVSILPTEESVGAAMFEL